MSALSDFGTADPNLPGHVLITGCSGGGKSTLVRALSERGHIIVPEPGLRIVKYERGRGGTALPWVDLHAFLWRAVEMAQADLTRMASSPNPVFYDRGLLDAAVGLKSSFGVPFHKTLGSRFPYSNRIFVAPPWRDIYATTLDRQHSFEDATREYDRIRGAAEELRLEIIELPRVDVQTRVLIVQSTLGFGWNED
ncbi:MAG: AAA family ATPase [Pseudomonadota bacterium]